MATTSIRNDEELDRAVTEALEWDPRIDCKAIAISVRNGVVTLAGYVDSYAEKLAAREAAHAVAGVLDVADQVQVKPTDARKTDAELSAAVRSTLSWDVYVPDHRIQSTVSEGWVTLSGEVDFSYERDDSVRAIERIAGVRGVTNRIHVKPSHVAANQVREAIENALVRRARRTVGSLSIQIEGRKIQLSGIVGSVLEREAAERAARSLGGVDEVRNEIVVRSES